MKTLKQKLALFGIVTIIASLALTPASFARESSREYNPPVFRDLSVEPPKAEPTPEQPHRVIVNPHYEN